MSTVTTSQPSSPPPKPSADFLLWLMCQDTLFQATLQQMVIEKKTLFQMIYDNRTEREITKGIYTHYDDYLILSNYLTFLKDQQKED